MTSESKLKLLCVKCGIRLPAFSTERVEDAFICTVTVGGQNFKSQGGATTKKAAEDDAAGAAIEVAVAGNPGGATDIDSLLQWLDGPGKKSSWKPFRTAAQTRADSPPQDSSAVVSYKSLLQQHMHKMKLAVPRYSTERTEEGFQSTVIVQQSSGPSLRFVSHSQPFMSAADQEAAKIACIELGLS